MSVLANFHYQITGPANGAPKLVFLHGVLGFAANWRRIAKAFEGKFAVLVYDQRGHGRSFHPETGYQPEDYANDLLAIIDELGWSEICLVGHSMGGRAALDFAARFPKRVTRLVIEDIGPQASPTDQNLPLKLVSATPVPFADKRAAKNWFDHQFQEIFKDLPNRESLAAFLYANITENEQKQAVWRFSEKGIRESILQGHSKDRWNEVRALKMPTLLIRGERSHDLSREVFNKMLAENPLIQGLEISGAGHWVHSDQPEMFIAALGKFFNNVS